MFAAKSATQGKAEIGMRPENVAPERSGRSRLLTFDHIYITLPASHSGQSDSPALAALTGELDSVAAQHGLERVDRGGAPGLARFDYRNPKAAGQVTHAIHIITPLVERRPAAPRRNGAASARLAIIIDDLGYDRAPAEALFALPFPLTVSVLPHHPHSADIAEEAHRRGYQVMLHLPMESSDGAAKPEPVELRAGVTPEEAQRIVAAMLDTVPHAAGMNNHQGSLGTADPQLMAALMPALRERNLFFIDSRTTTATVAYDAAERAGVRAASRKVFLDDVQTPEAVRRQLKLAVKRARREGSAIAIGHPYPATLKALEDTLPQLEAQGVSLVFVSQLVH